MLVPVMPCPSTCVELLSARPYPPGFRHCHGMWKPETLPAAHGGDVGLTIGLTVKEVARVPTVWPVFGAVLVGTPSVIFFAPAARAPVPPPMIVAVVGV